MKEYAIVLEVRCAIKARSYQAAGKRSEQLREHIRVEWNNGRRPKWWPRVCAVTVAYIKPDEFEKGGA